MLQKLFLPAPVCQLPLSPPFLVLYHSPFLGPPQVPPLPPLPTRLPFGGATVEALRQFVLNRYLQALLQVCVCV